MKTICKYTTYINSLFLRTNFQEANHCFEEYREHSSELNDMNCENWLKLRGAELFSRGGISVRSPV